MSQQALAQFIRALPDNPAWAESLKDAVAVHHGMHAIEAVARVASDAGYDVSPADAEAFRANALLALEDHELDEASLSGVSGGFIGIDDAVFVGTIMAGAVGVAGIGAVGGAVVGGSAVGGAAGAAAWLLSSDVRDGVANFFSKW